MKYEIWDKTTPINGVEAIDIIGEEQMENDDIFLIFHNDENEVIAIESIDTIKPIYGFVGETPEQIADEYIQMRQKPSVD